METVFSNEPDSRNTNKDLLQKYAFASKFSFSSCTLGSNQDSRVPPSLINQKMNIYKYAFFSLSCNYKTFFIAHTWNTRSLEDYTENASVACYSYVSETGWQKFLWSLWSFTNFGGLC
jgi:hypothetical protein